MHADSHLCEAVRVQTQFNSILSEFRHMLDSARPLIIRSGGG